MSDAITPYQIEVPDEALEDLNTRLARTRMPDQIPCTGWTYGTDYGYLRELLDYWQTKYDWRAAEAELNAFDHFQTTIEDHRIHFVHVRSPHENALPLLISHGWPGTVVEFLKVIGPLTDPTAHGGNAEDAFHVVCPSLPGYGFSEPTRETGFDFTRMAGIFKQLMARLGYTGWAAQGGDWGALVTTALGHLAKDELAGIHLNMPFALPPPEGEEGLSDAEKADLAEMAQWNELEAGYQKIQGTKPQTLGVGLNDSPAGLCSWITEKFHGWTDCDGDIENVLTKDELLTNVMVYWLTGTITSSMRLYYEVFRGTPPPSLFSKVPVPTGVARFPREIMRFPRAWVERSYEVTHWSSFDKGGHFAAMERPEAFVGDLREFFATVR
jgi:pimeloyl-ACP methyl ester carboxylesterase